MYYSKNVKEFAKVRMEQTPNNTQIARDIKNKFQLDKELDIIRRAVSFWREKWKIDAQKLPIRRLFFDIETSYYELLIKAWQLKNFQRYFDYKDIITEKKIEESGKEIQWVKAFDSYDDYINRDEAFINQVTFYASLIIRNEV